MDSGKTLSIVQEVDSVNAFAKGQRVRVLTQGALAESHSNSVVNARFKSGYSN